MDSTQPTTDPVPLNMLDFVGGFLLTPETAKTFSETESCVDLSKDISTIQNEIITDLTTYFIKSGFKGDYSTLTTKQFDEILAIVERMFSKVANAADLETKLTSCVQPIITNKCDSSQLQAWINILYFMIKMYNLCLKYGIVKIVRIFNVFITEMNKCFKRKGLPELSGIPDGIVPSCPDSSECPECVKAQSCPLCPACSDIVSPTLQYCASGTAVKATQSSQANQAKTIVITMFLTMLVCALVGLGIFLIMRSS